MQVIFNTAIWIVNGFLILLYVALERWLFILLVVLCSAILLRAPAEQRPRTLGAIALAMAAGILAPFPVPFFMLTISGTAVIMPYIERYNRPAIQWQGVGALGLYGLIGLGFSFWQSLRLSQVLAADPMMTQGSVYLNAIIGIAMYVFPIGFLAWSAKSIWAHPPAPASPEQIITAIRTRGK